MSTIDDLYHCLTNYVITCPKTTIPFYLKLVEDPDFMNGSFDTSYLDTHPELLEYDEEITEVNKIANLIAEIHHRGQNPYAI